MGNTTSTSSASAVKTALKMGISHKKGSREKAAADRHGGLPQEEAPAQRTALAAEEALSKDGAHSPTHHTKGPASLPSLQLHVQAEPRTSHPSSASTPSKPPSTDTPATTRGSAASMFLASGSTSAGSASNTDHANAVISSNCGEFGLMQKQHVHRSSTSEWVLLPLPLAQQRQALQEDVTTPPSGKGNSGPLPPLRETCEQHSVQEPSGSTEGSADTPLDQARQLQQQQEDPAGSTAGAAQEEPPQAPARCAVPGPRPGRKHRQAAELVSGTPREVEEGELEELLEAAAHMTTREGLSSKRALRHSYSAPGDCSPAKAVILSLTYGRFIPIGKQQPQQASDQASPLSGYNVASSQASFSKKSNGAEQRALSRNASHLGLGSSTLAEQYAMIWGSGGLLGSGKRRRSSRKPSSRRSSAGLLASGGLPMPGNAEQQLQHLQRRQMRRERNQPSQLARALVSSFRFDSRPKLTALPGVSGPKGKTRHASMLLAALPSLGDASAYLKDRGELSRDSLSTAKPPSQARELSTLDMLAKAKQRAQEEGHHSSGQNSFMLPPLHATSKGPEASSLLASSPRKMFLEGGVSGPGSLRRMRSEKGSRSVSINPSFGRSGPCSLQRTSSHSSGGAVEGATLRASPLSPSSGSGSGMGLLSHAIMSSCALNPDQPMCRFLPDQLPQRSPGGGRQHSMSSKAQQSPSHTTRHVSASGNIEVGSPRKPGLGARLANTIGVEGRSAEQLHTSL